MHNPEADLAVIDEPQVAPPLDAELRAFLMQAFQADAAVFAVTRHWHGSAPAYTVTARRDGALVAHAGVIVRDIRVGAQPLRIFGIQNMGVLPAARGTGAGLRVLAAVTREAARRGLAFGVLFCVPELERYYRRDGWNLRPGTARMDYDGQADIPIPDKNICMVKCLTPAVFPGGAIHLQGADW